MKNIISTIGCVALLASAVALTGCDSLLNQTSSSEVPASEFWKTEEDATYALMGAYQHVRGLFDRDYYFDGHGELLRVRSQGVLSTSPGNIVRGGAYSNGNYYPDPMWGYGKTFDAYSVLWVEDTASDVDFVNGFIETYGDPLGRKASWESTVNFINKRATERTRIISSNAQWFEDHSPIDPRFRKPEVKGVSAKVITVAMLGGDCYPATPIGINLPNADWIRRDHGSKSVTIENITEAYDKASQGSGLSEEFMWSEKEIEQSKKYGFQTDNLHTDLHECLGHGSGQLLPGVDPDALGAYSSTLEEARADLFGLYYMADPKMVELGLLPSADAYETAYYHYMMNGLMTQLVRIEPGKNVEEAHMRNRQLIARWAYEQGRSENVVELKQRDGKTFVVVHDYARLRQLFARLLAEVQRIKSEGDFEAGRKLVEDYGVRVDPALHEEVLARYKKLNLAPYKGFVNPRMTLVKDDAGAVVDVSLDYTEGYAEQMLRYSRDYSFLPSYNE